MSHFIIKCKKCDKVMAQCRCMDANKPVQYSLCDECGAGVNEPNHHEEDVR